MVALWSVQFNTVRSNVAIVQLCWFHASIGTPRTIGLAFDFEDYGAFDESIEEGPGEGAISQILSPFFEIHIGNQGGGAFFGFVKR